jgi:hypothetical protein
MTGRAAAWYLTPAGTHVRVRFPSRLYADVAYEPRHREGGLLVRPYVRDWSATGAGPVPLLRTFGCEGVTFGNIASGGCRGKVKSVAQTARRRRP